MRIQSLDDDVRIEGGDSRDESATVLEWTDIDGDNVGDVECIFRRIILIERMWRGDIG
jgi:hypothetical protein